MILRQKKTPLLSTVGVFSLRSDFLVQVVFQLFGVVRPAKPGEGLGFDLTDALPAHAKLVAAPGQNEPLQVGLTGKP